MSPSSDIVRDSDEIDQRPPVSELVADADPEELRDVLVDLVESHPRLAEPVESRLEHSNQEMRATTLATAPDTTGSDRQQVQYILRPTEGRSAHAYDP